MRRVCWKRALRLSISPLVLPFVTLLAACALLSVTGLVFSLPRLGIRQAVSSHNFETRVTRHALASHTVEKNKLPSRWRLDVGHAIDVLRKDVIGLFGEGQYTPDFSIFDDDITIVDARLPGFSLKGVATYEYILSTLQWSVHNGCVRSKMEITSITPPVNNEVYMRWRLHLWLKEWHDFWPSNSLAVGGEMMTVEGYSRYEFDPWTAQIVKHSIDITNPPMYITDLISRYAQTPSWLTFVPGTASPRVVSFPMSQLEAAVQL